MAGLLIAAGNGMGHLGDGTTNPHLTPAQASGLSDVVAIAASDSHSANVFYGDEENSKHRAR